VPGGSSVLFAFEFGDVFASSRLWQGATMTAKCHSWAIFLERSGGGQLQFAPMPGDTSKIDVAYVAHLARLQLSETEMAKFSAQLKDILAYVAKLDELDVSGVEPTAHAAPLTNVFRKDEVRPSIERGRILANAPEQARDLFIVPKIVE
jgi:aspartyl-tRNA(Asn)/glutamyl-tRNA(Gln) amidotransferase subunit C